MIHIGANYYKAKKIFVLVIFWFIAFIVSNDHMPNIPQYK